MMPASDSQADTVILRMLMPNLEAEGFRVFLHPSRSILPPFTRGYRPDATAIRDDEKVAIEVLPRSQPAEPGAERHREVFQGHPEWEPRIFYAPTRNGDRHLAVAPRDLVVENLDRLMRVFESAGPVPALLTGWSVFEAAARWLLPDRLGRPQPAGRLLEILASDGYVAPDEADVLRGLGCLRNDAAHGDLDVTVSREQIAELVAITRTLLENG